MAKKLKRAQAYYEQGAALAGQTVKEFLREHQRTIVHGGQATNAFLPEHLQKTTEDWDVFVPSDAKKLAEKLEHTLDMRYGGNYFKVEPAIHPGTFRVVSIVTKRPIADITVPERIVPYKRLADGINYATLDYHIGQIQRTLRDKEKEFRFEKDKETMQRIQIYKKQQEGKL